jgi:hypothetical protein
MPTAETETEVDMNKIHSLIFVVVSIACASADAASAPPVALPPFIITGRVVDYDGGGVKSAEVRVRKNGVLLSRCEARRFDSDTSANYALTVPMSNLPSDLAATVDDELAIEIDAGGATYGDTNLVVAAAKPGRTLKLNLQAAKSTMVNGVADQYLEDIEWDLEDRGLKISDYDPAADYDGDGVRNYAEYLAGTDAFDKDDAGLRILSWKAVEGDDNLMEATFLPGRNRAYSAQRAEISGEKSMRFEHRAHRPSRAAGTADRNYLVTEDEDPEVRAIYLYKEGAGGLYRLRLE